MKYITDFASRYGFESGDNIPVDAAVFRDVFVTLFNARAIAIGNQARALCYERPVGNYVAVLFITRELMKTLGIVVAVDEAGNSSKICMANLTAPLLLSIVDERVGAVLDWLDENVDWGGIVKTSVSVYQPMLKLAVEDCRNIKE